MIAQGGRRHQRFLPPRRDPIEAAMELLSAQLGATAIERR